MNFKEFIDNGKLNKFRKIKLDLTEHDSDINNLVEEFVNKFELNELLELRNILNNKLKRSYRGKLQIDFCLTEINKNGIRIKALRKKWQKYILEANDKVAKVKTEVERILSNEVKN